MSAKTERPYTIEIYNLLPATAALLAAVIATQPDLDWWARGILFLILLIGVDASTGSVGLILVTLFVFLEKAVFPHPLISFLGATTVTVHTLATAESGRPTVLRCAAPFLAVGAMRLLFPSSTLLICLLVAGLSILALFCLLVSKRDLRVFSNPLAYLTQELQDNRHRFHLVCVFFLSVGAATWGSASQSSTSALGALLHVATCLILLPYLFDCYSLEASSADEFAIIHSKKAELLAVISKEETALTVLQTSAASLKQDQAIRWKKFSKALDQRRENVTRELEQYAQKETQQLDAELTARKRATATELEAAFYNQSWDALTSQLCNKDSVTIPGGPRISTRDHLLMGLLRLPESAPHRIQPIFMHKKILHEHVHILGGTGTNKTSQGLTPLAIQLLRDSTPSPIFVLDCKGDRALFHTMREEAERNNRDFLFFSIESNKATYRFNPFIGIRNYGGTNNEKVQPLLDALGLNHGEGYGRSFFSRVHRQRMLEALRANPNIYSFDQLREALSVVPGTKPARRPVPVSSQKDELIAAIEGLSDYPQLYTTPEEEKSGKGIIQFDKAFAGSQVVYFWLPAPTASISVREIGKLVLYNLFFASLQRKQEGQFKQAYLFIDEFQRIIGENLALFLEQSRSYGISLTLANQNIDQLNTPDAKLWPLVQSNVRASLHFGTADPKEIELLSNASGEMISTLKSTSRGSSKGLSKGSTRTTSVGDTKSRSTGESISSSTGFSRTEYFDKPDSKTSSHQTGRSHTSSESLGINYSESQGDSQSSSENVSYESTETEFFRPVLRPHDISSLFNNGTHFLYWVRRGVRPLIDFGGKPVAVEGLYTMPKHLYDRRDATRWPEMSSVPGHVIHTPTNYRTTRIVTEESMVDQFLSALRDPNEIGPEHGEVS